MSGIPVQSRCIYTVARACCKSHSHENVLQEALSRNYCCMVGVPRLHYVCVSLLKWLMQESSPSPSLLMVKKITACHQQRSVTSLDVLVGGELFESFFLIICGRFYWPCVRGVGSEAITMSRAMASKILNGAIVSVVIEKPLLFVLTELPSWWSTSQFLDIRRAINNDLFWPKTQTYIRECTLAYIPEFPSEHCRIFSSL